MRVAEFLIDVLASPSHPESGRQAAAYALRRMWGGRLEPEMDAVLVLWGATVRTGLRIPRMGQTDVAPTLARVLGVELDAVEGRPLVGVLEARPSVSAPGAQP